MLIDDLAKAEKVGVISTLRINTREFGLDTATKIWVMTKQW